MDKKYSSSGYLQKIDEYLERSPFKGFLHEVDSLFHKNNILVNVYETDTEVIVEAELPGITKEQINIDIQESFIKLTIKDIPYSTPSKDTHIHHKERSIIGSERIIQMPENLKRTSAKASFKNGILEIVVQKQPYEQKIINIE